MTMISMIAMKTLLDEATTRRKNLEAAYELVISLQAAPSIEVVIFA